MSEPFGSAYAGAYDLFYRRKEYARECDLLEQVFARHATFPVQRILDLGCGTGSHAVILAERGYAVVGVDRSPDMLAIARRKAAQLPADARIHFLERDLASVNAGALHDAVVMLFAVLSYQTEKADVARALGQAHANLRPGGLLVADFWYGPAVLAQLPSNRRQVFEDDDGSVVRESWGELEPTTNTCIVHYRVTRMNEGRVVAETHERHRLRYFFAEDMAKWLGESGFELLRIGAFPEIDSPAGVDTWNATIVARAL